MGTSVSRQMEIADNELLQRFVAKKTICMSDDEYWDELLQYRINPPVNREEQLKFDSKAEILCQSFIAHNLATGNFGNLISVFLTKVSELLALSEQESTHHIWQGFNALFILRTLIKYMIETGSEYQLLQHFEALPRDEKAKKYEEESNVTIVPSIDMSGVAIDGNKFDSFINALINLIVVIPVKDYNYHLHLEALNTIIILLSIHLTSDQPNEKSIIFKTIYKCPHANALMSSLLHFVSKMVPVPSTMFGTQLGGSFVVGIAESIWSLLSFRKPLDPLETNDLPNAFREQYPLANQSLLLILILTNHRTAVENPFRVSLFGCADTKDESHEGVSFKIDFSTLYETICKIVEIDQATLLLYLLLHRNQRFYKFVMLQENVQQLVIPILQTLYNAPDSTSHHIYMSLIVLLILSEDDGFNKTVHQIILRNISWYTERSIAEISLGGLLILVVIRTIQYNMLKMRDKYLHTNCLAALANMSGQFRYLHQYVAQRLVSLFETLAKKHNRLSNQLKQPAEGEVNLNVTTNPDDMDLSVLEEVLRMVLEILNSCLSNQLVYCPNLVYTLLYKREVFEAFRSHQAFQDIIQNIDMVVGFFSTRLQRVQEQRGELGVNEVLEVITKGASQWSNDRLRKFPDLKFKYVEEDAPEEFFIPYVWQLVSKYGCVHFNSENMKGVTTEVAC